MTTVSFIQVRPAPEAAAADSTAMNGDIGGGGGGVGGDGDGEKQPGQRQVFLDIKPHLNLEESDAYDRRRYEEKLLAKAREVRLAKTGQTTFRRIFNFDPAERKTDVFYWCSRPVFLFLRSMGVFPFTRPEPGRAYFKWMSLSMAYAAIVFSALFGYVCYVGYSRVNIVRNLEGRFEEAVIAYLFLVNILPVLIVPLVWTETHKLCGILNYWTDFEILYFQISGRLLPLRMHGKGVAIAIGLPILSSLSVIVTHVTMVDFRLMQVIPYCVLDNLTYMMGAYWYLSCESLSMTAKILAEDFQQSLHHIGPASMVANYRSLWLRLSKLTRDTGNATSTTITFINVYLFFIITLSIYGLMSQLSEGFGVKDIGLAVTAVCNVGLLFYICDEAHNASQHVRTNFQKKLLMVELNWMNLDAQTEINMFLRATEMNPSNINCGGYFDVNRNLFKGLLTTMVTYLVVLLQFQISLPDENMSNADDKAKT